MSAYLFVQEGPQSGAVFVLDRDAVVVGRGEDCEVRLDDTFVSRRHFRVERVGEEHFLVDLGGRNPTLLNGAAQRARTRLRHGDELFVGSCRLRFSSGAPEGPRGPAAVETAGVARADAGEHDGAELVTASAASRAVAAFVEQVAAVDATVLVTGESGTGKEVVARALHAKSARAARPMVTLNCAAIPRELCESELFGHERGAFSGALTQHTGKFEQADGGTLFLDEIGELPLESQAKLLRVLEERRVTRVGGAREIPVDVRIVAATNRDLHKMAATSAFRVDLLYRLEVAHVHVAPLRERREDIEPLARQFLARFEARRGRGPLAFSAAAVARLVAHDWPGNVRELRNVVERASIFGVGVIGPDGVVLRPAGAAPPPPGGESIDGVVQAQIERALAQTGGNKKRAAELLGISRSSLYVYLDRFKLR